MLRHIRVVPLAAESFGVRSMCTYVETSDIKVLLDGGVSLCPIRYGLPPHPQEFRAIIEARLVTLRRITVGPHTKENIAIFVVPHKGPAAKYDGLLGMDVLRGLKFNVDFEKQMIIWE